MKNRYLIVLGVVTFTIALLVTKPDTRPASEHSAREERSERFADTSETLDGPIENDSASIKITPIGNLSLLNDNRSNYPQVGELISIGDKMVVSSGSPAQWAPWLEEDAVNVAAEIKSHDGIDQRSATEAPPVNTNPIDLFELVPELANESEEFRELTLSEIVSDEESGVTEDVEPLPPGSAPLPLPYFEPDADRD